MAKPAALYDQDSVSDFGTIPRISAGMSQKQPSRPSVHNDRAAQLARYLQKRYSSALASSAPVDQKKREIQKWFETASLAYELVPDEALLGVVAKGRAALKLLSENLSH